MDIIVRFSNDLSCGTSRYPNLFAAFVYQLVVSSGKEKVSIEKIIVHFPEIVEGGEERFSRRKGLDIR